MSKSALIVDDSRLACKIMANMLDTMGIESVSVYSAEEALSYLQKNKPDMLFLDHSMPGMDGLETIQLIKSNPVTATIPVLMYTAKEGEVYVGQARALGAVDVLPKGMEKDHLYNALSKLGFVDKPQTSGAEQERLTPEANIEKRKAPLKEQEETTPLSAVQKPRETSKLEEWQIYWQRTVEPFLRQQKHQQSEEIRYTSNRLAVQLKKEIHKTLEQFEHALTLRIESHDDFKELKYSLERKKRLKLILIVALFIITLHFAIFWQLMNWLPLGSQSVKSSATQEATRQQLEQQFTQLNQQLQALRDKIDGSIQTEADDLKQKISLVDDFGVIIADDLLLTDQQLGKYSGMTSSGYRFLVNAEGNIISLPDNRYFMTADCSGDKFVSSAIASIYADNDEILWYVHKDAIAIEVAVGSLMNETGVCIPVAGLQLELLPLERNYLMETGIDDTQGMKLLFSNRSE